MLLIYKNFIMLLLKVFKWNNVRVKSIFFVLLIITSSISLKGQNKVIASRVDSLLINLQKKNRFSGAVYLSQNGNNKILDKAYGFSNFSNSLKNSTKTQFSLASLGKIFTIIAVLKLIENGELKLEDSLKKFNINFKDKRANNVTIKQLLAHTSGFGHYWENEDYLNSRTNINNISKYIDFIKQIQLDFDPGTKYQYSNVGYILLGKVIEYVSGDDYYGHIQKTIFTPLEMNSTNFNFKRDINSNYAKGYSKTETGKLIEVRSNLSLRGASDGGGYSTVGDLSKLSNAIFYDGFLSNKSISLMTSNYESEALKRNEWTFDLVGGAPGVSTVMGFHGPSGYSIIVLSNMDSPASENVLIGTLGIITEELSKPQKKVNNDHNVYDIFGKVVNANNNKPIPYTNIGIKNKGVGSASGEDGSFNLTIENKYQNDYVTFSALGYFEENYSVLELSEKSDLIIKLNEKSEQLDEVVITANKPKLKKVGNSSLGLFSSGAYIGGGKPGATLATIMQAPSDNSKLQKVYVHIRDNDLKKKFKLRLRILETGINNQPEKDILNKSIIISSSVEKGWLEFDLNDLNLFFENDFYVGIEWIEELNERLSMKDAFPRISYSSSKKTQSYARTTSLNSWNPIAIKPNIYAEFITK
jgi:CubicO group peptidase (beta-lactamase class C family)